MSFEDDLDFDRGTGHRSRSRSPSPSYSDNYQRNGGLGRSRSRSRSPQRSNRPYERDGQHNRNNDRQQNHYMSKDRRDNYRDRRSDDNFRRNEGRQHDDSSAFADGDVTTVRVRNIDQEFLNHSLISQSFSRFGPIHKIMLPSATPGVAYIRFQNLDSCESALRSDPNSLGLGRIRMDKALKNPVDYQKAPGGHNQSLRGTRTYREGYNDDQSPPLPPRPPLPSQPIAMNPYAAYQNANPSAYSYTPPPPPPPPPQSTVPSAPVPAPSPPLPSVVSTNSAPSIGETAPTSGAGVTVPVHHPLYAQQMQQMLQQSGSADGASAPVRETQEQRLERVVRERDQEREQISRELEELRADIAKAKADRASGASSAEDASAQKEQFKSRMESIKTRQVAVMRALETAQKALDGLKSSLSSNAPGGISSQNVKGYNPNINGGFNAALALRGRGGMRGSTVSRGRGRGRGAFVGSPSAVKRVNATTSTGKTFSAQLHDRSNAQGAGQEEDASTAAAGVSDSRTQEGYGDSGADYSHSGDNEHDFEGEDVVFVADE